MATAARTFSSFKAQYPNDPTKEYRDSEAYDIVPTIAFIQGCPVFSLAASWGMRYVFTGGEDGFVRKYDFLASLNGAQLLTVSQRHMLPDSITKAGVLSAYWENEQPLLEEEYQVAQDGSYLPKLSPVYSLVAQAEALWVCAGLESGGISFQSATYGDMGQCVAYLDGHTKAVSDLRINGPENQLLSGSWDKSIALWDLDAGVQLQNYGGLAGQVSCVEWQPLGAVPVGPSPPSPKSGDASVEKGDDENDDDDDDKSMESLFGSDDDEDEKGKEKARASDAGSGAENPDAEVSGAAEPDQEQQPGDEPGDEPAAARADAEDKFEQPEDERRNTGHVFMSATFNGMVEIWDARQRTRSAWLAGSQAPPWCMSACWSHDGNRVYVGHRNATIDEYDIRSMEQPRQTLRFPAISGAVSCVAPMPNNRNLLCASYDNIRMYDLESQRKTPFFIIPGHHGTIVSRMLVDTSGKFLVSTAGGRGWTDSTGDIALGYEIEARVP